MQAVITIPGLPGGTVRPNSVAVRWSGHAVLAWIALPLALASLLAVFQGWYHYPGSWLIDLKVYRFAVITAWHGVDPYSVAQSGGRNIPIGALPKGGLSFVYPPFSLLLFAPFAALSLAVSGVLWTALSVVALQASVFFPLRGLGVRHPLAFAVALTVPALFLSPVDQALQAGQLSLPLLGMVVLDLHLPDQWRFKGMLIGLAAGLKLVPGIFVLYLLVMRRFRAAAVAAITTLATMLVGFVLFPRYSMSFWSVLVFDTDRIAPPGWIPNESLQATTARVFHSAASSFWPWIVCTLAVLVVGAVVLLYSHALGEETLGIAAVALVSLLVSPVSWHHYWVWLVPVAVYVAGLAVRYRSALLGAAVGLALLVVALRVNEWFMPMPPYNALDLPGAPLVSSSMCTVSTVVLLLGLLVFALQQARARVTSERLPAPEAGRSSAGPAAGASL